MQTDYLGLNAALYEWADSYDSKDWDRLRKCIAPTLRVSFVLLLYTSFNGNRTCSPPCSFCPAYIADASIRAIHC
jgi:scytalone dehydratase